MTETNAHRVLKVLSCRWLREQGFLAVAPEVMDATGRFRVDVAGWSDRPRSTPYADGIRTAIIECKQSRSDYLRDGGRAQGLLARRAEIVESLRALGSRSPNLYSPRPGSPPTLFDQVPLTPDRPGREVRALRLELNAIERRIFRGVKFSRLARWQSAHALWVAAPQGLISPSELPRRWGLLEVPHAILKAGLPRSVMASNVIHCRVEAETGVPAPPVMSRLLRNIAVANSRFAGTWQPSHRQRSSEAATKSVGDGGPPVAVTP